MTTAKILEMIKGLLYGPFFDMGNMIWDTIMFYVFGAMTTTPQGYSADAWNYVSGTVYPWSMGIASVLLNLFDDFNLLSCLLLWINDTKCLHIVYKLRIIIFFCKIGSL